MAYGNGIESILTSWRAIRTAIRNKGATLPDNTPIANWPAIIDGIETGSSITGATLVTGVAAEDLSKGDPVVRRYQSDLSANFVARFPDVPFDKEGQDVAFSPDSLHLAVVYANTPGKISVYKLINDAWVLFYTSATNYGGALVAFSPSGKYLTIANSVAEGLYVDVYKVEENAITYLERRNMFPLVTGTPKGMCFAPNKDRLYITTTYVFNGVSVVALDLRDDVSTIVSISLPGYGSTNYNAVGISDDGLRIAFTTAANAYIYDIIGDTYALVTTISTVSGSDSALAFVPGSYDIIFTNNASTGTPFLYRYNFVAGAYVAANFTSLSANIGVVKLGVSRDGLYLFIPRKNTTTIVSAYKLVNGTYTFFATPKPTGTSGNSADVSPDGRWVAYGYMSSPIVGLAIYENLGIVRNISKVGSSVNTACATDIGFANADALQGETVEMTSIIRNPSNYPV